MGGGRAQASVYLTSAKTNAFDFIVSTPAGTPDARLAIAASRAGALGVLDLEFTPDPAAAAPEVARLLEAGRGRCAVRLPAGHHEALPALLDGAPRPLDAVLLTDPDDAGLAVAVATVQAHDARALVVVTDVAQARAAEAAGADALIAKGHEAGGWVGEESTFVLLQRCSGRGRPGLGARRRRSATRSAACLVAGAAGAVLDAQLLLAPRIAARRRRAPAASRAIDGSETLCLGQDLGARAPLAARGPTCHRPAQLTDSRGRLRAERRRGGRRARRVARRRAWPPCDWTDLERPVLALGQDAASPPGSPSASSRSAASSTRSAAALDDHVRLRPQPTTRSREEAPLAAVARHPLPDRAGPDDARQRPRRVRRGGRRRPARCRSWRWP